MNDATDVLNLCKKLEQTTRRLRRILLDRVDVPTDGERARDLSVALLEGHRLLTAMHDRYGEER